MRWPRICHVVAFIVGVSFYCCALFSFVVCCCLFVLLFFLFFVFYFILLLLLLLLCCSFFFVVVFLRCSWLFFFVVLGPWEVSKQDQSIERFGISFGLQVVGKMQFLSFQLTDFRFQLDTFWEPQETKGSWVDTLTDIHLLKSRCGFTRWKKHSSFALNPGCLIGILRSWFLIPYILNNHRFFCLRSFPDLDLDFDDLGGNLTWVEPTDDQFVEFYAIYQALPLEDGGKGKGLVVVVYLDVPGS